jgi:hypothetical protein
MAWDSMMRYEAGVNLSFGAVHQQQRDYTGRVIERIDDTVDGLGQKCRSAVWWLTVVSLANLIRRPILANPNFQTHLPQIPTAGQSESWSNAVSVWLQSESCVTKTAKGVRYEN